MGPVDLRFQDWCLLLIKVARTRNRAVLSVATS